MANPNLAALTSILGVSALVKDLATGGTTLLSAPTTSHAFRNLTISICNKTGTNCWVTVTITRSAVAYTLVFQLTIPANATLVVASRDMGVYLNDTDSVQAFAQTATSLDAVIGYEDIS